MSGPETGPFGFFSQKKEYHIFFHMTIIFS